MEWTEAIRQSIDFMEAHILEEISSEDVAASVHVSALYFQKGFTILTGYTPAEYIRNRRLYLAAMDIFAGRDKIIDLAYKYGYDTPESFSKAFRRFHGVSPMQIKAQPHRLKTFLPLVVKISVEGGNNMDYRMEKKDAFKVIGMERKFSSDNSYEEIPKFWDEFNEKYSAPICNEMGGKCTVGKYGICLDEEIQDGKFSYLIAGDYEGGDVPEGLVVKEISAHEWAIFTCIGPMPAALQSVNTRIFNEWLPGNKEYEIAESINIEMYTMGDVNSPDYVSEIWIPVKRK
ncbi:MAG: effector binding domain-containing protein [Lachnospiraceae bacterium]